MKAALFFSLLGSSLAACTSPAGSDASSGVASAPPVKQAPTQTRPSAAFDVPALLKLNLSQIEKQLGKPDGEDTPNESEDELERTYARGSQHLVITYNTKTREIGSFFLPAPGPTELVKNCNKLLAAGNLTAKSSAYHLDSLASNNPGQYLGIVVVKQ